LSAAHAAAISDAEGNLAGSGWSTGGRTRRGPRGGSRHRLAYVEGRLQSRTWEAADGSKRRTVEVVAEKFKARSRPARRTAA